MSQSSQPNGGKKQTSILGFFKQHKKKTLDSHGDTILLPRENLSQTESSQSSLLIAADKFQEPAQKKKPKKAEEISLLSPPKHGLKRNLEGSLLIKDFCDKAAKKKDHQEEEDNVEDDHEITDVTSQCSIEFIPEDLPLSSTRIHEEDGLAESIFLRTDHSLLYFMFQRVLAKHAHLFSRSDADVIEKFLTLPEQCQTLYLRVFKRKRKWQRVDEKDMFDRATLSGLVKHGFFEYSDESHFETIEELVNLLKVAEVQQACRKLNIFDKATSANKKVLLTTIQKAMTTQKTLSISPTKSSQSEIILNYFRKTAKDKFVRLAESTEFVFHKIILLFYNPYSVIAQYAEKADYFFLFYLKAENFFDVPYEPKATIYQSSEDYDHFVETARRVMHFRSMIELPKASLVELKSEEVLEPIYELLVEYCQQREIDNAFDLPPFLRRFRTSGILFSALSAVFLNAKGSHYIVSQLLKTEQAISIISILLEDWQNSQNHRLPLQHRLLRLLNKDSDYDSTDMIRGMLSNILQEPRTSVSGMYDILTNKAFQKILPELKESLSSIFPKKFQQDTIYAKYRSVEVLKDGFRNSFYIESADGQENFMSVEQIARYHYFKTFGFTKSLHCEGSVYLILFHALFKDTIMSDDPDDVFRYYRQELPLDMKFSDDFVLARKFRIASRLEQLRRMSKPEFVQYLARCLPGNAQAYEGRIELVELLEIGSCIGPARMAAICDTILSNYCDFKKGFPDLLLWIPNTDQVAMVEVKGNKDQLSGNQILWLNKFDSFGFHAVCCHVFPATDSSPPTHSSQR